MRFACKLLVQFARVPPNLSFCDAADDAGHVFYDSSEPQQVELHGEVVSHLVQESPGRPPEGPAVMGQL